MIIELSKGITADDTKFVEKKIEDILGTSVFRVGKRSDLLVCMPVAKDVDIKALNHIIEIEKITCLPTEYQLASREYKRIDTVVKVQNVEIGSDTLTLIAGPCAVEDEYQICSSAKIVQLEGGNILRGGAYKPGTSPYSFQGTMEDGLKLLMEAKCQTGLPVVTEVVDTKHVELVSRYTDMLQIGARNMQNYSLLKEVGRSEKPVLLKRGMSATIEEWILAAEYILYEGNPNVVLCERGIRTYETATRNTFDISAIIVGKTLTHLPIIADASHSSGRREYVAPMSRAALAAGADGLIVEVHYDPAIALSDNAQQLDQSGFSDLVKEVLPIANLMNRKIQKN